MEGSPGRGCQEGGTLAGRGACRLHVPRAWGQEVRKLGVPPGFRCMLLPLFLRRWKRVVVSMAGGRARRLCVVLIGWRWCAASAARTLGARKNETGVHLNIATFSVGLHECRGTRRSGARFFLARVWRRMPPSWGSGGGDPRAGVWGQPAPTVERKRGPEPPGSRLGRGDVLGLEVGNVHPVLLTVHFQRRAARMQGDAAFGRALFSSARVAPYGAVMGVRGWRPPGGGVGAASPHGGAKKGAVTPRITAWWVWCAWA